MRGQHSCDLTGLSAPRALCLRRANCGLNLQGGQACLVWSGQAYLVRELATPISRDGGRLALLRAWASAVFQCALLALFFSVRSIRNRCLACRFWPVSVAVMTRIGC